MSKEELFTIKDDEKCPDCLAKLVMRSSQHGAFLGCSRYPACSFIRPLKASIEMQTIKLIPEHQCPLCQAILAVKQGRYGMFISCSHYPACPHTELIDKPDETLITCPRCQTGKLLRKTSKFGKIFYACSNYPTCKIILNLLPIQGSCVHCGYPLLVEKKTAKGKLYLCADKQCGQVVFTFIGEKCHLI